MGALSISDLLPGDDPSRFENYLTDVQQGGELLPLGPGDDLFLWKLIRAVPRIFHQRELTDALVKHDISSPVLSEIAKETGDFTLGRTALARTNLDARSRILALGAASREALGNQDDLVELGLATLQEVDTMALLESLAGHHSLDEYCTNAARALALTPAQSEIFLSIADQDSRRGRGFTTPERLCSLLETAERL